MKLYAFIKFQLLRTIIQLVFIYNYRTKTFIKDAGCLRTKIVQL